jgi:hypothetical protein
MNQKRKLYRISHKVFKLFFAILRDCNRNFRDKLKFVEFPANLEGLLESFTNISNDLWHRKTASNPIPKKSYHIYCTEHSPGVEKMKLRVIINQSTNQIEWKEFHKHIFVGFVQKEEFPKYWK